MNKNKIVARKLLEEVDDVQNSILETEFYPKYGEDIHTMSEDEANKVFYNQGMGNGFTYSFGELEFPDGGSDLIKYIKNTNGEIISIIASYDQEDGEGTYTLYDLYDEDTYHTESRKYTNMEDVKESLESFAHKVKEDLLLYI